MPYAPAAICGFNLLSRVLPRGFLLVGKNEIYIWNALEGWFPVTEPQGTNSAIKIRDGTGTNKNRKEI